MENGHVGTHSKVLLEFEEEADIMAHDRFHDGTNNGSSMDVKPGWEYVRIKFSQNVSHRMYHTECITQNE